MKWKRVTPKFKTWPDKKPQHYYEAETEHGKFTLTHRRATNARGRTFKYKVWILWVDGRSVSGSRRYRLTDAKAFAELHLLELEKKLAARRAWLERTRT